MPASRHISIRVVSGPPVVSMRWRVLSETLLNWAAEKEWK